MQTSKFLYQAKRFHVVHFFLFNFLLFFLVGCAPNHYLCYKDAIKQPENGAGIVLEDQFRKTKALVIEPMHFYNPVQKTKLNEDQKPIVTKIKNRDYHLTGYRVETDQTEIRTVWVKNQFSKKWQKMEARQSRHLLVPTQKIKPHFHKAPENLDHYLCYEVVGENVETRVALKDQFQGYDYLPTGKPVLLCNPVKKTHKGKVFPIKNRKWHLVGYKLDHKLPDIIPVTGNNQFGKEEMRLTDLDLILIPSLKRTVPPKKH